MKRLWLAIFIIVCVSLTVVSCEPKDSNEPSLSTNPLGDGEGDTGLWWEDPDAENTDTSTKTPASDNTQSEAPTEETTTAATTQNQGGIGNGGANNEGGWGPIHPA